MTLTDQEDGQTANDSSRWTIYTEDWDPAYGSPATFDFDDSDSVEQAEPGTGHVAPQPVQPFPLCFVDGTRRAELSLWAEDPSTAARLPGLVGAYAVGAVNIRPGREATFAGVRIGRLAIWGGGHASDVVGRGGFMWKSESTLHDDPAGLLAHLQNAMRLAEGGLALEAAAAGWTVVLDGPLNRIRTKHGAVTGYIKTHRRQLLPADAHRLVPTLAVGERTRLFTLGKDRYTCYTRIGWPGPGASSWGGIARLEFPANIGLVAATARADQLASTLPPFAGVAHRDPRAPVNLTPVRNLEKHLSRTLGRVAHATRAARDAVIAQRTP